MDKSKISIRYYTELAGNSRKITAQLPSEFNNKVRGLLDRQREIESPHIIGESIRNIKFVYFFADEKQIAFVRFEIHKFVNNCQMIELLIRLAADKLEKMR